MDPSLATFLDTTLPAALARDPLLFDLGATFAIETPDGTWLLDLRAPVPSVRKDGAAAEVRFRLASADLLMLAAAPGLARELFQAGRIRVEGPIALAQHLPAALAIAARPEASLQALLGPVDVQRFLQDWPDRSLVVHGALERVAVAALPELQSVATLLEVWDGHVRLADRQGGQAVPAAQGLAQYEAGRHLAFSDVEQVIPVLQAWLARLRWETGLPVSTYGRCLAYASPDRVGEVLHFDQNVNFVLQLRGRKTWRLAENHDVARPLDRYTSAVPVVPASLRSYAPESLPTTMPEPSQTVVLEPGSLLVLPRGYWHETQADGESFSLNFTFDQPTWADVVGSPWRERLLPKAEWRELATGAGGPHPARARAAEDRLRALIDAVGVTGLDAAEALARLRPSASTDPVPRRRAA